MNKIRLTAAALAAGMLLPLVSSCASSSDGSAGGTDTDRVSREDFTVEEYSASGLGSPSPVQGEEMSGEFVRAAASFGFDLLSEAAESGNVTVSPLSVLYALGMTSLGASGETRAQMEKTLFGGIPAEQAARYLYGFSDKLPGGEGAKLEIANSLWLNQLAERFSVNAEFISANASYYGADVFGLPFTDDALDRVNGWVSENTDGMIPKVLNELNPETLMLLINTVLFDGKWAQEYTDAAVSEHDFTSYDGTTAKREMLSSSEKRYFRLGNGAGFIRPYEEKYSFVGILPDEGEDVFDYAASIDGAAFVDAVLNADAEKVQVRIPSFTFDFDTELSEALGALGMPDAFDGRKADFSAMGACADGGNLYVSAVIHKTRIEVSRAGTKAAAATVVGIMATSAAPSAQPKQIYLDRPFVFAIVENDTGLPVFCGIVSDLK